jgi:hypothetical protein
MLTPVEMLAIAFVFPWAMYLLAIVLCEWLL